MLVSAPLSRVAGFLPGAAAACMHAMDRQVSGSREWAISAASAFDCLRREECRATSYPHWWSDEGIKALSARVLAAIPNGDFYRTDALEMRGRVLSGREAGWEAAERTPAELREASGCFGAAAAVEPSPEASDAFRALASRSAADEAGAAREALLRRRQHMTCLAMSSCPSGSTPCCGARSPRRRRVQARSCLYLPATKRASGPACSRSSLRTCGRQSRRRSSSRERLPSGWCYIRGEDSLAAELQ